MSLPQLMGAGDFPAALELIERSQSLLADELSGVGALGGVTESLAETRRPFFFNSPTVPISPICRSPLLPYLSHFILF